MKTGAEHVCATEGCSVTITGRMIYCRSCSENRRRKQRKDSKKRNKGKVKTAEPKLPPTSYQSMHNFTEDLRIMEKMGFTSYGQLSVWRREEMKKGGRQVG